MYNISIFQDDLFLFIKPQVILSDSLNPTLLYSLKALSFPITQKAKTCLLVFKSSFEISFNVNSARPCFLYFSNVNK